MDKKNTDIVAYLTFVGLIIAFVMGDRKNSKFHINQALVLCLASAVCGAVIGVLAGIPFIGWIFGVLGGILELLFLILWFIGLVDAIQGREKPIPLLGNFKLFN